MTHDEEDGSFRFEVPPGRYRLEVQPLGEDLLIHYPRVLVLEDPAHPGVKAPETRIQFRLPKQPTQQIEGVAIDADGHPAANVVVHLSGHALDGSWFSGDVTTDDDGEFGFEVAPNDFQLRAESKTCPSIKGPPVSVRKGQTDPVRVPVPLQGDRPCPESK
jgi:hypothetical protein